MKGSKYYTDGSECKYSVIEQKTGIFKATFYYKFPKCAWGRVVRLNGDYNFLVAYIDRKIAKFDRSAQAQDLLGNFSNKFM